MSKTKQAQHRPVITPEARAAMMALDAQIATEDAHDFSREMRRIKAGLPEPPREPLRTYRSWSGGGLRLESL